VIQHIEKPIQPIGPVPVLGWAMTHQQLGVAMVAVTRENTVVLYDPQGVRSASGSYWMVSPAKDGGMSADGLLNLIVLTYENSMYTVSAPVVVDVPLDPLGCAECRDDRVIEYRMRPLAEALGVPLRVWLPDLGPMIKIKFGMTWVPLSEEEAITQPHGADAVLAARHKRTRSRS